ncbi:MAG TPA: glutaredoxin family protein [Steroidobacteraceae bacterium]|nr:glutaredoxin family protein [Steroidobacteraceae bacterium]
MAAPRLTLVQRHDCALCDEMLAQLQALGRTVALPPLELLDVDSDPQLRRRHGLEVPVLLLDGTVVCRHRLDRGELERLLRPGRDARP